MTNFTTKLQIILKNGKNGHKLLNNISDLQKFYNLKDVAKINTIYLDSSKNTITGARNNKGKQFAVRAGRVY